MNRKAFNSLGLAMRAGKLLTGEEAVLEAVRTGEAKLVVIASDVSDNARKKITDKCTFYKVALEVFGSREELGASIGKPGRVVAAVTDSGFARMIADRIREESE